MENIEVVADILSQVITTVGIAAVFGWLVAKLVRDRETQIVKTAEGLEALSKSMAHSIAMIREEVSKQGMENLQRHADITESLHVFRQHVSENYVPMRVHDRAYDEIKRQNEATREEIARYREESGRKLDLILSQMIKMGGEEKR